MRKIKSYRWIAGNVFAKILLLLALIIVSPASLATASTRVSGPTTQVTPTTEDATTTALNKEKLTLEIQQLKNQNEFDLLSWLQTNASALLSTLVVVIGGLIGLFRWLRDRRDEREKHSEEKHSEWERRAEERFQYTVTGLSDDKEGARIGAAILLRTFLRPGHEQFYSQAFNLAVAHLRLPAMLESLVDLDAPLLSPTLSQALTIVFKEAFPLARSQAEESPQSLDASGVQLDNAYLKGADLKRIWMRQACLRKVLLDEANLSGANLYRCDLSGSKLSRANLSHIDLYKAKLYRANLIEANLRDADLGSADLREAQLSGTNLLRARSLQETDLRGAMGLTKEQLEACKAKGAIIDEISPVGTTTPIVVTTSPTQNNGTPTSSALTAQRSTLSADSST